jgi:tRNA nucleotidyltransferase/poly(A) polymerase
MWEIIPESIKQLHRIFKASNKSLYLVGGSVRDFLNNETPKDYDLATDATPTEVLEITKQFKSKLQGEAFGVVVVRTDDGDFEVATLREDIYGDKLGETRNPEVKFSTIDKDVLRRDLTFNALFYDLDKQEIIDLVGGVEDMKNKIARFVGNPTERIIEDPLRILRILRFSERYGFTIDKKSADAIIDNVDKLSIITNERIWEEIVKAHKQSKNFYSYISSLIGYSIADQIFKGLYIPKTHISKNTSLEMHFAFLFMENSTAGLLDKMKFEFKIPHDFSRKVVFLLDVIYLTPEKALDLYKKKVISGTTNEELVEWYELAHLHSAAHKAFLQYEPSVNAEELMLKGFKNRALGEEIKRLELLNFNTIINV